MNTRFDEDQPFLLRKFRAPAFDPAAGMTNDELRQALAARVADWDALPRPVGKARVFEFICDHMAIAVGPHDLFPAFACHDRNRRPFDVVKRHWEGLLNQRLNHWKDVEEGNRVGRFMLWKDFDHSVPDWDDTLRLGFAGILRRALEARAQHAAAGTLDDAARAYFDGIEITYRCIHRTLTRVADLARAEAAAADDPRRLRIAASIEAVRDHEPRSLYEALQFIYLYFMFSEHIDFMQVRSLGNLDRQLIGFYEDDLRAGRDTDAGVRECFDYFFMQWVSINNYWGQPAYLGGTKTDGSTEINTLSYLILDELDKLRAMSPKFQLKINRNTPAAFLRRALTMVRDHNASLVFVCEPGLWRILMAHGATAEEARTCDLRGCYEAGLLGQSNGTGSAHVNLLKAIELALNNGTDPVTGTKAGLETGPAESLLTFDDFYHAVLRQVEKTVADGIAYTNEYEPFLEEVNPANVFSPTIRNSLRTAKDGFARGCVHNNTGILFIGAATAVDALLAVRKSVYEQRAVPLAELRDILARDWAGAEKLRARMLNDPLKYGNGNPEVDAFAAGFCHAFASFVNGVRNARGGRYHASIHTARQYIDLGKRTGATPDGRAAGDEMSKNASPTMGMDRQGVTALIRSMTTLDPVDFPGDFPLDVMLLAATVRGEDGLAAMETLVKTYLERGGWAIHFNIFSPDELLEAQRHPEKYEGLQVRVCGWNARFNDMEKREQDAYIARARHLAD